MIVTVGSVAFNKLYEVTVNFIVYLVYPVNPVQVTRSTCLGFLAYRTRGSNK